MLFKGISYLELWWPFCSAEWNNWCNFGRRYPEKRFCAFILNLDLWFRMKCRLKDLSGAHAALLSSGAKLFMQVL